MTTPKLLCLKIKGSDVWERADIGFLRNEPGLSLGGKRVDFGVRQTNLGMDASLVV